jgi:hypothetical protein
MGTGRIREIITSVFQHRPYRLLKYHNPVGEEVLEFDFGRCTGTVEEAVLAMVAVEKVFRLVPDPGAGEKDRVFVDKRVDEFLKKHFGQYDRYFGQPAAAGEGETGGYLNAYSHLREDEQYDDLTILAIRKK